MTTAVWPGSTRAVRRVRGALCGIHPGRLVRALHRRRGFRPLGDEEKELLAEQVPAHPGGGRALDACCGTGDLAVFLASLGYAVDGADFAEGALTRARSENADTDGVRWLCLDVEHDDLGHLDEDGYDLITKRLAVAFIRHRCSTLRRLASRLRTGGALVIITPLAENTPAERRHIALDEDELGVLCEAFESAERFDAAGLAVLVLRRPGAGPAGPLHPCLPLDELEELDELRTVGKSDAPEPREERLGKLTGRFPRCSGPGPDGHCS
ncbi:class I SAM-dependent methyltransferase [Streptomyces sp. NPDC046862]|uniref:class I SAM-dependent methyltransferase n=1 Tax=Streptomyces sp. NPDC046862 TaxID=3154603 RepID=UPI003454BB8A